MTDGQNVYYGDYLQLDKLLDAQQTYSELKGEEAHDEMLFIITHQVYELWFKQINHELKLVSRRMGRDHVEERKLGRVVSALHRIEKIQDILSDQTDVNAIHVVGHANVGQVVLGNSILNAETINSFKSNLETIGESLTKDGDILFYGCNLAKGREM